MEMDQVIGEVYAAFLRVLEQPLLNSYKDVYRAGLANGQLGAQLPASQEDQTPFSQMDIDAAVEKATVELHALVDDYKAKMEQALADDESDKAKVAQAEAMKEQVTAKLQAIKAALSGIELEIPAPQAEPVPPVVVEEPKQEDPAPVEAPAQEELPATEAPADEQATGDQVPAAE